MIAKQKESFKQRWCGGCLDIAGNRAGNKIKDFNAACAQAVMVVNMRSHQRGRVEV